MGSTYTNLLFHIVFSTKHRDRFISSTIKERLHGYMGGIIRSEKGHLYQIGGMEDHVHLLVRWHSDDALADLLCSLKSRSSQWVHETFPQLCHFAWQEGYAAFSVSHSESKRAAAYIANQENHHSRRDFKGELVYMLRANQIEFDEMLRANQIEFDERYLWG